jgi:hypothetical protein
MAKKYSKKKSKKKGGPNADGPKYRTPDHFKLKNKNKKGKGVDFKKKISKQNQTKVKFNPASNVTQHRG